MKGPKARDVLQQLEADYAYFNDTTRLAEGMVLFSVKSGGEGRVAFGLTDLPLKEVYRTEKGILVQRTTSKTIVLQTPDQTAKRLVNVDDSNTKETSEEIRPAALLREGAVVQTLDQTVDEGKKKVRQPIIISMNSGPGIDISFIDTIRFEALQKILGGKFVKRTIVLTQQVIKISRKEKTLAKEAHGSYSVLADVEDDRQFTLVLMKKSFHFVAQSHLQREQVLGAIRSFAEKRGVRY